MLAEELPSAKPEDVGMSSERLQEMDLVIQEYLDEGRVHGVVVGVTRRNKVVYYEAHGVIDPVQTAVSASLVVALTISAAVFWEFAEWTSDRFLGRPGTAALRGGGWGNNPHCLRVSYRHGNRRDVGRDHIGFRCAADP